MSISPVIHHHFNFSNTLLEAPERSKKITFKSIPFFKLYDMRDLKYIRDTLDVLNCESMPHEYQEIIRSLKPSDQIANSCHREELIPLKYCVYNRQPFFVRVYRLRQKTFLKVEITLHSDTLGEGKYYDFTKALRSAESFFKRLEEERITPLTPFNNHLDEYFFIEDFERLVRALQDDLKSFKEYSNPPY